MSTQTRIRPGRTSATVAAKTLTALLAFAAAVSALPQNPAQKPARESRPDNAVLLDRVVAVVNNHAILASDVDDEMRLAVLDPGRTSRDTLTPKTALDQLISRALIEQQIRQEDAQAAEPTQAEVDARLAEIRKELPVCVRLNCASAEGWKTFLAAHDLTADEVEVYLRHRLEILRFIEQRFRQGIRIAPDEIETYYRKELLPRYAPGETAPTLEKVAPRIEEILLERQVNVLFDDWLNNLRKQGDVEVLGPDSGAIEARSTAGKGER